MTTERKRIRRGRAPVGDRNMISVRYPPEFHAGLVEGAELCRVPLGHYVIYRAARCEGWPVPVAELRAVPTLILLYDAEEWPAMLEGLPSDVVEALRLEVPEVADLLPAPVAVGNAAYARAVELREQGLTWYRVAMALNAEGLRTARGARWYPSAVEKLVEDGPPVTSAAYARAVELREQGLTPHRIALALNAEGLRTERGSLWYGKAVKKLIPDAAPQAADDPAPPGEQETSGRRRAARTRKRKTAVQAA